MQTVKVVDMIGSPTAVSPRAGLKAYDFVSAQLNSGIATEVSFDGVEDLTSAFCNAFIGKLYVNHSLEMLQAILKISGIEENHVWFKKVQNAILLGTNENARTLHKENLAEVIFS
jgi:hypothetical protein